MTNRILRFEYRLLVVCSVSKPYYSVALFDGFERQAHRLALLGPAVECGVDYFDTIFVVDIEPSESVATLITTCPAVGRAMRMPCRL